MNDIVFFRSIQRTAITPSFAATPLNTAHHNARTGVWLAVSGYGLWGIFPLYFLLVKEVPASEVLAHRIVGACILLMAIMLITRRWSKLRQDITGINRLGLYLLTAIVLSGNWVAYIWAIQHERILETSLGYFINPLTSVMLGLMFLGERLRRRQWYAVGLAGLGVGISIALFGTIPWVALWLAGSFSVYSLLHKKYRMPALEGLMIETALITPLALWWFGHLVAAGQSATMTADWRLMTPLLAAGVVTILPLLLFLQAMHHLRMVTIGLLQYIAPSLQFAIGIAMGEPFGWVQAATFGLIWLALAVFTHDALNHARRTAKKPAPTPPVTTV